MTRTRVNEIDLLRFLAALSVVFFHYAYRGPAGGFSAMPYPLLAPVAEYGFLGVELFFMISGFVVLMTAAASARLRDFCISRVVRLYPAFWTCCTLTFLASVALAVPRNVTFVQYVVNLTMVADLFRVPLLEGAYWSLLVEIRFYALVAALLIIGKIHQAQRYLAMWLLACIALELLAPFAGTWIPASALHVVRTLLIFDYAAYFIAGATCFLIWREGPAVSRVTLLAASWALAIYQSGVIVRKVRAENAMSTLNDGVVIGILTLFFLVMALIALGRTGSIARYRWPLVGAISYPLYLLHQNIGYLVFNRLYPTVNAHLLFWGMIAAVLGAAYGVHVLVERRFAARMKTYLTGALASRARAPQNM
ncbi:Peptidoglycan/LPS O-acetylase OafA/YrhL, contains acyltransferase and SGNH-hydrolase domains [Massilia sp. PDC64]|nr:acyltransferase [Massilia sp. PDC64]SDF47596.1 Peptidoglycan/LPS O-acetylase OafA/YrhL, contains acyltransferase and SGNH-hydrolase domains [Massilia sp. PDC64]